MAARRDAVRLYLAWPQRGVAEDALPGPLVLASLSLAELAHAGAKP